MAVNWILSTALALTGEFTLAIEAARRAVQQAGSNVRSEANLGQCSGLPVKRKKRVARLTGTHHTRARA